MSAQQLRILLVEDDPDDAEIVRELLDQIQATCTIVHEQLLTLALRRLESEQFDLALLDLSLPDSWGIETLRRLRQAAPAMPIVLMTGATLAQIKDEAASEGALACVIKSELDATALGAILDDLPPSEQ